MSVDLTKTIGGAINITYGPYNGYVYFFHSDGTYSRFNRRTCELEYYATIVDNWNNWPVTWPYPYAETSWADDQVFFFRNPNYVSFNMRTNRVEGSEQPIQERFKGWPDGWLDRVDAALYWGYHAGEKRCKVYFFRDDEYIRCDVDGNHIDEGYDPPAKIATYWPGWPTDWSQVWAAVDWGNGKVYFFTETQYLRYDKFLDRVDDEYPKTLADFTKEHKDKIEEENKRLFLEDQVPAAQRPAFTRAVRALAKELDVRPNWIMASISMESEFDPNQGKNGGPYVGLHQMSLELIYDHWDHAVLRAKYPHLFQAQHFEQLTSEERLILAREFAALGFDQIKVIGKWLKGSLGRLGKCRSFDQFRLVGFGGVGFAKVDRTLLASVIAKDNSRYDLNKDHKIDVSEFREAVFELIHIRFQDNPTLDSELRHSLG